MWRPDREIQTILKGDRGHIRSSLCRERHHPGLGPCQPGKLSEYGQEEEGAERWGFASLSARPGGHPGAGQRKCCGRFGGRLGGQDSGTGACALASYCAVGLSPVSEFI